MCVECKKSAHRYCAGVPMDEFESADGSYMCLSCLKKLHESKMADMSDCIETLKAEIVELREALKEALKKRMKWRNPHELYRGTAQNLIGPWLSLVIRKGRRLLCPNTFLGTQTPRPLSLLLPCLMRKCKPMDEFESTDGSYTCLSCLKTLHESKMADMSDCIETLKAEIVELREALKEVLKEMDEVEDPTRTVPRNSSEPAWSMVVSCNKKRRRLLCLNAFLGTRTLHPLSLLLPRLMRKCKG